MTQLQFLTSLYRWLADATFLVSALFPFITAPYWPWWRGWWGRNIVALESCIALVLMPAELHRYAGVAIGLPLDWVTVAAFACVPLTIIWRIIMIYIAQRNGARGNRELLMSVRLSIRALSPAELAIVDGEVRNALAAHAGSPAVSGGAEDGEAVRADEA